jgi:hypothetical protein
MLHDASNENIKIMTLALAVQNPTHMHSTHGALLLIRSAACELELLINALFDASHM